MTALTPLDGRYANRIGELVPYLSEDALIRYRVYAEVEWLIYVLRTTKKPLTLSNERALRAYVKSFAATDAEEIRRIETATNHDVKAVELWLGSLCSTPALKVVVPYIHIGRTSEDINNIAYACMLRDCLKNVILPETSNLISLLQDLAHNSSSAVMLARTHGQPASPTTFGKEVAVFVSRLQTQLSHIADVKIYAKCNGATGTFAADLIAFPGIDWPDAMETFITSLGLGYQPLTTQIEPHDWIARMCNELGLMSTICIGLCRDFWHYISLGYLSQRIIEGEVGSSTMPHKVNPIDFENAEANFGVGMALFRHLAEKLPISRLQRDLSDSSALRSLSEALGHYFLATKSLKKGLAKVYPNAEVMRADLADEWSIVTEAIQTIMRKNGIHDAYDQLKSISRGKTITKQALHNFISGLAIDGSDKERLLNLTPETYIGYAAELSAKLR